MLQVMGMADGCMLICDDRLHANLLRTLTAARVTHVAGQHWHCLQPAVRCEGYSCSCVDITSTANDAGAGLVPIPKILRDWVPDLQRPALK